MEHARASDSGSVSIVANGCYVPYIRLRPHERERETETERDRERKRKRKRKRKRERERERERDRLLICLGDPIPESHHKEGSNSSCLWMSMRWFISPKRDRERQRETNRDKETDGGRGQGRRVH